ncbi:MAG: GRP family sugar transporter [Acidobacteriaceae bacterium]
MYQPEHYAFVLIFMILSMLCWGSWANTVKLVPGYRFQLFYWDYVIGLFVGALGWAVSLGSFGSTGRPFVADFLHASPESILFGVIGGIIFNVANLLLVAAIDIAGLAVAFPVGIGIALVVGAVSSYLVSPTGNVFLLFGGIALVLAAIVCDAIAYRERERTALSRRGVIISVISGLLMGSFYPFVAKAMSGEGASGPYAISVYFVIGVAICCVPVNFLLMRHPLDGKPPVAMRGYSHALTRWHLWGILGGIVWCTGAVFNFVASQAHVVGPAVSYSIGQGATMISAVWGVFVWREFASASSRAKTYLVWMFVLFLSGLSLVALAPVF